MLKYLNWHIVFSCLIIAVCLFAKDVSAQANLDKLQFKSSKGSVVFAKYDSDFLIDDRGIKYAFNKKIIILSLLSVDEISQLHDEIKQVQVIASIGNRLVYWVTPRTESFFDVYLALSKHQDVLEIEPDIAPVTKLITSGTRVPTSNTLTPQNAPLCDKPKNTVRVAIIDDGFDFTHPEFDDLTVLFEYDPDKQTLAASAKNPIDYHGTRVVGVIAAKQDNVGVDGFAPTSEIIAIRQVSTWSSSLILAFQVAKLMKADVINCSWVLPFLSSITSLVIEDVASASNAPIIVFSAGNSGKEACEINQLSALGSVVVVGSINKNGGIAPFSNYGQCVDYYAPSSIASTSRNGYANFGGTSSSAAIVSGIVAQLKACGVEHPLTKLTMVENIYAAHKIKKK
ncbi:S8/S53 family peptidase [Pseudoalteromonas sp. SCSIO 43210]